MKVQTNGRYVCVRNGHARPVMYQVIDMYTREVLIETYNPDDAIRDCASLNDAFEARDDFVPNPADIPEWIR